MKGVFVLLGGIEFIIGGFVLMEVGKLLMGV